MCSWPEAGALSGQAPSELRPESGRADASRLVFGRAARLLLPQDAPPLPAAVRVRNSVLTASAFQKPTCAKAAVPEEGGFVVRPLTKPLPPEAGPTGRSMLFRASA